jgi:glucose-1-phosphate thymidylyltransferase
MISASNFIKTIEDRQGLKVGCIEEIAYMKNFINKEQLFKIASSYKNKYGEYLKKLILK